MSIKNLQNISRIRGVKGPTEGVEGAYFALQMELVPSRTPSGCRTPCVLTIWTTELGHARVNLQTTAGT